MALGSHKNNCTLSVPGYGSRDIIVTELGYGFKISSEEAEARRTKAFYAVRTVPGPWYVDALFVHYITYISFQNWLLDYYNHITDPELKPLLPITVTVPSRGFRRVGYPSSDLSFGDEKDKVIWKMTIAFTSATEPDITARTASRYLPPLRDIALGSNFHPSPIDHQSAASRSPYSVPEVERS